MSEGRGAAAQLAEKKRELLARLLKERGILGPAGDAVVRRPNPEAIPLSFAQQRLWFLDQLEPESPRYNAFTAFRLEGALHVPALAQGLGEILRRHEALRMRFVEVDGEPELRLDPAGPFPVTTVDLRGLAPAEQGAEVQRLALAEARLPFRLAEGPLVRATLLRLADAQHVLLLSMHHIVSDGWSMGVFVRELWTLYEAFRQGRPSPLPELPVQYADFAAWQREQLQGDVLEGQLAYWRKQLAGLTALELPTDRPRPPVQGFAGAWRLRALPAGLIDRVRALSQEESATPYMTLLAVFAELLRRYSGQDDVVVGSPISNRTRAEVEGLIGFFANTLVLRIDVSGDPTVRELVRRVRDVALGAYTHQDLPFERLVGELTSERDLSRSPLFQVAFVLQSAPREEVRLPGLTVTLGGVDNRVSKFDLTLSITDSEPGSLAFEYSTDLFEAATVDRLAAHLEVLLQAAVEDPGRRISELPLLTSAEEATLREDWNATHRDYASDACVHQLIEAQVRRTPDAVALAFEGTSLTYSELNRRANRLASHLRQRGVGPEVRVGICLERSPDMVVALLGALKAGGAYVPLDPGYPEGRLAFMLSDADVAVLVTDDRLAAALPPHQARVVRVDGDADAISENPEDDPGIAVDPDNLAYVIYTSGSTGQPKGAMNTHRGVCNRLLWMQEEYGLRESDRVLQKTPFSFDVSVWEFFWPLMVGARLVVAKPEGHKDSAYLARLMEDEGITTVHFVPSMLRVFLEEPAASSARSLRRVICSGEALSHELQERFFSRLGAELHNLYGPTEAAVDVTRWACRRGDDRKIVPIGRPVANTRTFVLDRGMRPVPSGVVGELYLGGIQVGRGYLARPGLTAEKFVPDPFGGEPGGRLYRTGDLARWLPEGSLEYVGRIDHQVKVRGFRIELGEIESALLGHPNVRDAVVVARDEPAGEKRLVGYVVGETGATDLRAYLGARLPEYMVPSLFVSLESLPLSPSGKVDRRGLPAPASERDVQSGAFRTPVEEALGGIWERVLGVEGIGPEERFFELGGHSLLATRVMAQLRRTFGVELPLRALFDSPTVRGLAQRIEEARGVGRALAPAIEVVERGQGLPLSFAQQRMWFLDQLEGGPAYNVPLALRLAGDLDVAALERSLLELVKRHESLRTRFEGVGGLGVQVVEPAASLDVERVDLQDPGEGELRRLVLEEVSRPFDLKRAPLLRAKLLRLGEEDHGLVLTLHHIVSDGWSLGILARELGELYGAYRRGEEPRLPDVGIQYGDYAAWQRGWLSGEVLSEQVAYWRDHLSGVRTLRLPTDHARPAEQSFDGSSEVLVFPPELLTGLKEVSRRHGATLFMTLLAAFQALLGRWAGEEDVAVGTPIANRTRGEVEGVVGFFVNSLVMRTDLSGDPPFRELLGRVKEVSLGAYDHQDVPFEKLVEELEPERDLGGNPLFQVMFALQNAGFGKVELPGLRVGPLGMEVRTTHFDLELHLVEQSGSLVGAMTYRRDLFEAETIRRLLEQYGRVLWAVSGDSSRRLSSLPFLTEGEEALLEDWNATRTEYPRDQTIGGVFAGQAQRRPDSAAVTFDGQVLSYQELEARSNRLARHLRSLGVKAGTRVGVSLERSLDLPIALLGIVKAGGAYVPLDPSYPKDRRSFMVSDSGVSVLLTQERLLGEVAGSAARVVCLDRDWEEVSKGSPEPFESGATTADLAYVTYTSGSTGTPKGVEIPHRGVLRLVFGVEYAEFGAGEVFLQLAPVSFDASTLELWGALLHGGKCVLYPGQVPTARELGEVIEREGVTTLWLTASLYNAVLDEQPEALRGLKQLLIGGEALSVSHVRRGLAELPGTRIVNGYGPTEGTTFTCCHTIPKDLAKEVVSIPIGRPISNTRTYVLDGRMGQVPIGVAGELYIGGDGLARGYLDRPELTAEKFVPDPFGKEAGGRLYRTGDLVRHLPDGTIEFLGRKDSQVKVRGFRIELGEIESALGLHAAVKDAVVVVREDHPGEKRLVAYVTTHGGEGVEAGDLRKHLKARLPEYMVPSSIVWLEALPLSPNGKVDRRALPVPAMESGEAYEGPRTRAEAVLSRIWSEVLRVPVVGIRDNFFELGGDSILSLQVVARANEAGLRLSLKQLFQAQTIEELARAAGTGKETEAEQGLVTGEIPLSPVQRWFFEQELPEAHHFNQALLLGIRGEIASEVLEEALLEVERHHDALRTRFEKRAEGWRQWCVDSRGNPPERLDLRALGEREAQEAIEEAAERTQRSLDLTRGPLWRAILFESGKGQTSRLLWVVHHLVVDGVSWRVLLEDLQTACEQLGRGRRVKLPRKTTSFKRWSERLRDHTKTEAAAEELTYWRRVVEPGSSPLPVDHPGGEDRNTVETTRTVSVVLGEEETRALLQEVPAAYRTQIGDVLLTAVVEAFSEWTGRDDLLIDLEGHGREDLFEGMDPSRTVGWFTTIYPVRLTRVAGGPGEALKAVKEELRRVPSHGIGYGVLRYLRGEELRSEAQVSFNYLGQFDQVLGEAGFYAAAVESPGALQSPRGRRAHLLEVNGRIAGGRLRLDWSYSEAVHDRGTVERLARSFEGALSGLIEHCRSGARGCTPSDFPLAKLDQARLERVAGGRREVEDIYPLSPMQEGMLFHGLMAPGGGLYLEQGAFALQGRWDASLLESAWNRVVERHGILRTRFHWEGVERPLQVVERRVSLPWEEEDWSDLPPAEQDRQFEELLQADRQREFDPGLAPLMRLKLVRLGEESHRFVWSFHHALLDGWSLALIWKEVLAIYRSHGRGGAAVLEDPRPYREFIGWIEGQAHETAGAYWRGELAGFAAPTPLGVDRSVRAGASGEPGERAFNLGETATSTLRTLCRRHGLTLNTLVQGAWAVLLSRYSGERRVLYGVTVSGRPPSLPGVETMVGLFINTVPLLVEVPDDRPLLEWLKGLQARQVEQRQYEHTPLAQVQKWSDVEAGRALFESLLVFENYPVDPSLRDAGQELRIRGLSVRESTNYPLTLVATPGPGLHLRFLYDRRRLDEGSMSRLEGHLTRLLEGMARRPEGAVSELPLLGEGEREQVLVEWNRTRTECPREKTVAELFELQAEQRPDAVAVSFERQTLSYGELNRRSNQLARHLNRLGVGPETRVGICIERSLEMIVGLVGILKAGGAYVPLDPDYPQERLTFLVEDAELPVLLTQEKLLGGLPKHRARVLCVDRDREAISREEETNPSSGVGPENLAYVTYTSGSTGKPKGVEVRHRGVVRLLFGVEYAELGPDEVFLQLAPVSFDASTLEVWGALLRGGRCVVYPERVPTGQELGELIEREGVTTLWLTSSLYNAVLDESPAALRGVKQLLIGGEALSVSHVRRGLSLLPGTRIINGYGPTESTTFTCCYGIPRDLGERVGSIPIGRPIGNTRVYVLDRGMEPVPIGVGGELFIGGEGLARGYLKRPDLTAERFVPDPFGEEAGGRLYRTGDLVRYLADGNVEFLGRVDHQVKVRGFRIELGEIESALREHPGIKAAVAMVREDHPGEKRLVAYVVGRDGPAVEPSEVRSHLKGKLPEYMVPSTIVCLESLPSSPNGKVDRRALPAPDGMAESREAYEVPRTPAEEALARIWAEVLRVPGVGVRDNFFELGGDSILSIQIVARARESGLRLTLKQVFEHPTVADLAAVAGTAAEVEAEQGVVTGDVPLTPVQRWFFEQDLPEPHHFNQAVLLDVRQPLLATLVEQAVADLQEHHDALRTRYERRPDGWRQEVVRTAAVAFTRVDLGGVPDGERGRAIELEAGQAQRSLDLEAGPLWRVVLFDLGEGRSRLLVVIHHLVVDGVSWRILLEDLQTAYEHRRRGQAPRLPPKTTSFRRWAEKLSAHARSGGFRAELAHWQAVGGGFDALPVDLQGGENTVGSTRSVFVELTEEETQALLQDVPAVYRTQVTDVLLAGVLEAFWKWTGRDRLLIDVEGHGREDLFEGVDLSRTVGWFTTIYPLGLERAAGGAGAALKGVKEQVRAIPGAGLGYGVLRYLDEVRADLPASSRAEMSFNYLGQFDQVLGESSFFGLARESPGESLSSQGRRPYLVGITGAVSGGRLGVAFTYSEAFHRRSTIEGFANGFAEALRGLVAHCESPDAGSYTPSDFPLARLDQAGLDRVLGGDRDVEDLYPLSPMQQGLLFHTLMAPESGMYFEQMTFSLEGELDGEALRTSWRRVVERHAILRTRFVWEGLREPLQVVGRTAHLSWEDHDWREADPADQDARLSALLETDRRLGFGFAAGPLMRLALIRTGEASHRLVWSFHHILLDGWCLPLVLKEVLSLYQSYSRGRDLDLGEVHPYKGYIAWLSKQDLEAAEAYWREALAGFRVRTPLGVDRGSGATEGRMEIGEAGLLIAPATTAALKALGQRHQVTLSTMVQAAWGVLLSRYCGDPDIVFGVTVSGRPAGLAGVETMVGLFINTLPMRVQVRRDQPVVDWLKALQARQVEQKQYEYSPLVKIQEWSALGSGQALFESLLVFENYPVDASGLRERSGTLKVSGSRISERTNYPLTVLATPGSSLAVHIAYDRQRFEARTITGMLGHLANLLEGMALRPEGAVSELSLLGEAERQQVLHEWNATRRDYPDGSIPELFESQVERTPDLVAVSFEGERLTYAELNRRSNQLARRLARLGVGPEVRVGIFVERSPEMVVGLLGILKAGGAYVPLDPAYPREHLAFTLEDAEAPVLLTQERLLGSLPKHRSRVVCLDRDWEEISGEEETNPSSGVRPENLAYVIYTSGSTGRPKGVAIAHRSTVTLLHWARETFEAEDLAKVLASTSICFDLSVFELFVPLCVGGTAVVVENALALASGAERPAVTLINTVPSAASELLKLAAVPESVRAVVLAGEPLSARLAGDLYALPNLRRVFDCYGPSEDTTYSTCALREAGGPATIGRPIANTQVYVLGGDMEPLPAGVTGELYIGGAGLSRGYLNRPEITAEKFVPDPFSRVVGGRLYRTGDLARYAADGSLEFLGRMDHQVKVRGFRIELGEVESVLGRHPGVAEAVVMAREDGRGDKRLVAYVVSPSGSSSASELRRFVSERLPGHMVPAAFVMLDAMPLTPNGKVDRRALPAPDQARPDLERPFVLPRGPFEEAVAGIWTEVLGVERVGADDNFFDLGGHSLKATQVISRIRDAFQVGTPLRQLFETPTVAGLAASVEAARGRGERPQAPPIRRTPREGAQPLSFSQERLWFLDQLQPGSTAYSLPLALRLTGSLNVEALRRSLEELVRRHESLRTTFTDVGGRPVQVVAPPESWELPLVDLVELEASDRLAEARRVARAEVNRGFDLSTGPLFRTSLLRLADDEHVLLLTLHHSVADGWSLGVLMRELATLYRALATGQPASLPELPVQYADYARWQRDWLQGEALETQLSYWRRHLRGAPPLLELPTDRTRSATQGLRGGSLMRALPRALSARVNELCRLQGVTLFMALLAAFKTLLHRHAGQEDVVVGTPIAGRGRPETEGLIGFFVNTLVLRTDLSGNPSFRELLRRVREVCLGAYDHQDVPFERLVEELRPERDLARTPLFQVMFNLLNLEGSRADAAGTPFESVWNSWGDGSSASGIETKFDLTLYAGEQGGVIHLGALYAAGLFDGERISGMLEQLEQILVQVVGDPEQRIDGLSLVTEAARKVLPDPTEVLSLHWHGSLQDRFSSQARRVPARPAVTDGDQAWSYGELERASNQLAHHLRAGGVGPGDVVAIHGHRSASLVWALLGVLKAGGAFLILDPAYPGRRLAECVRLAEPSAFIRLSDSGPLAEPLAALVGVIDPRIELPSRLDVLGPWSTCPAEAPGGDVDPEARAYVAFTSGSTGTPKGILGTHRPISHFLEWHVRRFGLGEGDRFCLLSGLAHDPLLRDVFTPLWLGATLCVPGEAEIGEGRLGEWMARERITVAHLTPTLARLLHVRGRVGTREKAAPRLALRYAFFGGESLTRTDVASLRELTPEAAFVNYSGATETPQAMGYFVVEPDGPGGAPELRESIPIGRGIDDTQLLVLNRDGRLAGVGERGEIHVRTPYLAEGYLGDEAPASSRFQADPFTPAAHIRIYRSGDLARYRPDGAVEFAGRNDQQIKLRGFRIETAEVESALAGHPQVAQATVVLREDAPGQPRLVAYVVPRASGSVAPGDLEGFLADRLPRFMVPSQFVLLGQLPLTPNGKVDRRALPPPEALEAAAADEAPRNDVERVLAAIWAELLGRESVGIHANFFELGGHSLLATQVISRVGVAFDTGLPLRTLFQRPTVAGLAAALVEPDGERPRIEHNAAVLLKLAQMSDQEVDRLLGPASSPATLDEAK
jgi:amino acid adenylation domain-containing protein/non-ribosomal peptide synthase protein (TIGR01720 family)